MILGEQWGKVTRGPGGGTLIVPASRGFAISTRREGDDWLAFIVFRKEGMRMCVARSEESLVRLITESLMNPGPGIVSDHGELDILP